MPDARELIGVGKSGLMLARACAWRVHGWCHCFIASGLGDFPGLVASKLGYYPVLVASGLGHYPGLPLLLFGASAIAMAMKWELGFGQGRVRDCLGVCNCFRIISEGVLGISSTREAEESVLSLALIKVATVAFNPFDHAAWPMVFIIQDIIPQNEQGLRYPTTTEYLVDKTLIRYLSRKVWCNISGRVPRTF
jgi:hypothetical protein